MHALFQYKSVQNAGKTLSLFRVNPCLYWALNQQTVLKGDKGYVCWSCMMNMVAQFLDKPYRLAIALVMHTAFVVAMLTAAVLSF